MNYYISHSRNSALTNNLTATSYLSHLLNLLFLSLRRFSKEESDLGLFRSQSVFKFYYFTEIFFACICSNVSSLDLTQCNYACANLLFFFRYISPLGQGSRTHGMIARWAKFLSLLCVINCTVLFIDVRTVRLDWMILLPQLPYQGHTIVCFSYLSTQASKILNLSHEGIINSVVPPSTNGTLTSEKTFPSKSWDSFTSFIFSGLPPKSNNKTQGFATQMGPNVYTVLTFLTAAQFQDHQKQKRSSSPTMHWPSCSDQRHTTEYSLKI